ncbi:MAG TPA: CHAT domain-containing protein, partial [Kofleriaceae bacterium]
AGHQALRAVIQATAEAPSRPNAPMVRGLAFDALVDAAATAARGDEVLALLAERLGAPDGAPCVLGVASWNRLIVAVRDARGEVALEARELPAGQIRLPAHAVVSPAMRARLAGCARIAVLAPGPYFGAPRLLDDEVAWSYRSGHTPVAAPLLPPRELVVSDVAPPDALQLPRLHRFEPRVGGELLSGMAATPARVLERMTDASLIVIVAHGFTDVSEPSAASLVLSAGPGGDYLLTASKVQAARLANAPAVVLAGCDAGRVQVTTEPWSLATSFLQAGARTVIAPTEPVPDDSADQVFRALVDRLRSGDDPAVVLASERRLLGPSAAWLSSIVVFDR